jgi:hypothetical protein
VIWQEAAGQSSITLSCLNEPGQEYCLEFDEPGARRQWHLQVEPHWDYFPPLGLWGAATGGSLGGYLYVANPGGPQMWAYVNGGQAPAEAGSSLASAPSRRGASSLEVLLRGLLALGTGI